MGPSAGAPAGYNTGNGGLLWNTGNPSYASGGGGLQQHPSSSAYPTSNLGYSQQPQNHPSSLGFNSRPGMMQQQPPNLPPPPQQQQQQLPLGSGLSFGGVLSTSAPSLTKPDDARVIDSLFGTTTSTTGGGIGSKLDVGTTGLLSGLNSLSLTGDSGVLGGGPSAAAAPAGGGATGLWGPSSLTDSWTPNNEQSLGLGTGGIVPPTSSSIGDIFSGPFPSLSHDQPQESRFNWNSSNNNNNNG
jgi:hypothetical protein